MEFQEFPKIPRLSREMVITEKIDGTNATIAVLEDGRVLAGSRNRWITPADDNFGFARWVMERESELRDGLGIGVHRGEWWGSGIQRGYGLTKGEKRFSLFNTKAWTPETPPPACCSVVPTLYIGLFNSALIDAAIADLRLNGSAAAPGFMKPEGVVIYHVAARQYFKKTIDKDDEPKGARS